MRFRITNITPLAKMNDLCTVQRRSFHFPSVLMTNSVQFSWMLLGSPLAQFVNERSEPSIQWKLSSWLSILRDSPIHIYDEPADTTWRTNLFSSTLWIEVKLLFIPAQYVCAWSQGIFTVISLKQELFKRSQSGVEHNYCCRKFKKIIKDTVIKKIKKIMLLVLNFFEAQRVDNVWKIKCPSFWGIKYDLLSFFRGPLYLTIIPRGRVGYEMIHSQRGA